MKVFQRILSGFSRFPPSADLATRQVVPLLSILLVMGCGGPHEMRPNVEVDSRPSGEVIEGLVSELAISSGPAEDAGERRARAYAAVERLSELGKHAFPYLLKHLDDNRESVELQRLNRRQTVGEACYCIIVYQIFSVPPDYFVPVVRTGADGELHQRPFSVEQGIFDSSSITAWLKQREADPLAALQVEAIEWLVEEVSLTGLARCHLRR